MDFWDKFEHSGKIEDYLAYKQQAAGVYTYDILKNDDFTRINVTNGTNKNSGSNSAGVSVW